MALKLVYLQWLVNLNLDRDLEIRDIRSRSWNSRYKIAIMIVIVITQNCGDRDRDHTKLRWSWFTVIGYNPDFSQQRALRPVITVTGWIQYNFIVIIIIIVNFTNI